MKEQSVKSPVLSDDPVFKSSRKIRLGIWGLGRGMSFWKTIAMFPFEVAAGCDFNETMRRAFHARYPKALATDDADAFLRQDFDAVPLATYCVAHADHAIRCLEAGKHVLSEVTAFFTLAEGVRLVEALDTQCGLCNGFAACVVRPLRFARLRRKALS